MNTGKVVGLAIIIVAICPILVGMVWPTGTETVDTWEAQPGIDVTGDLASRQIDVYDEYTGPMNNLSVYYDGIDALQFPTPRQTTTTPNSYPVSEIRATQPAQSVTIMDLQTEGGPRFGIGSASGFTVTGQTGTFDYADYWPKTNVLVLYDSDTKPVATYTPKSTDTFTGTLTIISFNAPTEYIDMAEGLTGNAAGMIWVNGLHNRGVDMWISFTHTPFANTFSIGSLSFTWTGSTMTVTDGTTTAELGSAYTFMAISLAEESSTVTGLIGAEGFTDLTYAQGNSLTFAGQTDLDAIGIRGTYFSWWVKQTDSVMGGTSGMRDSSLVPESYFGQHAWQVTIVNPSTFGTALRIAGPASLDYPIEDGSIEVTNIKTGEASSMAVRGIRILSLVLDDMQHIYIGGVEVARASPQDTGILFEGDWLTSVVVSKVVQGQKENYVWTAGGFGLEQGAYCMVGLMACVCVAIAGSVWGRTTGESVLALHITMILCGAAYICMM